MTAKLSHLQAELDALQAEINSINIEPLVSDLADAKAAQSAHREPTASFVISEVDRELSREVSAAETALTDAKNKLRDLNRRFQPLARMLSAPDRLQTAREDLATLQTRAVEASSVVVGAQATKNALAGLLTDAQVEYAALVESAAKAVLAGAKMGKAVHGTPVDRGQVDALQSALEMSEAELITAEARHAESLSDLAAGERQLTSAITDAAGLRFELQTRDFVDAVCAFEFIGGVFDPAALGERCLVAQQIAAGLLEMQAEQHAAN